MKKKKRETIENEGKLKEREENQSKDLHIKTDPEDGGLSLMACICVGRVGVAGPGC